MKLLMPKMPDPNEVDKADLDAYPPGYRPLVRPDTSKMKNQRRGGPPGGGRGGGPPGMRGGGEKAKDFKGSMKQLIKYMMVYKWLILLVAVCSVCSTLLSTINPKILARITNEIVRGVAAVTAGGTNGVDPENPSTQIIVDDAGQWFYLENFDMNPYWWTEERYSMYHPYIIGVTD